MNPLTEISVTEAISRTLVEDGSYYQILSIWSMFFKKAGMKLSRECIIRDWYPTSISVTLSDMSKQAAVYLLNVKVLPGYLDDFRKTTGSVLSSSALEDSFAKYISEYVAGAVKIPVAKRDTPSAEELKTQTPAARAIRELEFEPIQAVLVPKDASRLLLEYKPRPKKVVNWRIINRGKSV